MGEIKRCPICHVENTGGKPHGWHKHGHRKSGFTTEQIAEFARQTLEVNQVKAVIFSAVDLARQPDHVRPKVTRVRIRRKPKPMIATKNMRRRVRPLIAHLCRAVDLGRITATW